MIVTYGCNDVAAVEPNRRLDGFLGILSEFDWRSQRISGLLIVIAFLIGCSPNIEKEHVFQIAEDERTDGIDEKIILTVLERGQYVLAVDGKIWRSDFVDAKYSLQRNGDKVALPFLTVNNPVKLWDSFVMVNDTWYCIDISGSPYRDEERKVHVIQFNDGEILRRIDAPWNEMECRIRSVSILIDGTGIIIDNSFEGKFVLDFAEGNDLVVLDESEFIRKQARAKALTDDGIFLNMGVFGTFGKWCQ